MNTPSFPYWTGRTIWADPGPADCRHAPKAVFSPHPRRMLGKTTLGVRESNPPGASWRRPPNSVPRIEDQHD
jgi:hypothetical protein